ncbi:MAG: T9SS type A sorting domain-containing protein, partial [Bacteroidota bacterium]
TVNPLPSANAGADQTICAEQNIILTAIGGTSYSWSDGVQNGVAFIPTATTTYTVTVTNSCGSATDEIVVTINPLPIANAGTDQTICAGQNIILTATGGDSYSWSDGVQNGVAFIPTATSAYTVTVTNSCGSATDDVVVNVTTCPGITNFTITNNLIVYPNPSTGTFIIETSELSVNTALHIYSIDGRLVYTETLNNAQSKQKHTINLSGQPSGVYFLKLMNDESVVVKKLVIDK